MASFSLPPHPRLLVLGGGHSHVEVLRAFGAMAPEAHVIVATRDLLAPYSGMLPGFVAGHYTYGEAHIDVRPLARRAGAVLFHAEATGLDLDRRVVSFAERAPLAFDLLSINVGSHPSMANVPGAAEFAIPAKPVDAFITAWRRVRDEARKAAGPYRIVVVGAGAGGVELCLTMGHALRGDGAKSSVEFHLVANAEEIMPTHTAAVRKRLGRALSRRGVTIHRNTPVARVESGAAIAESGVAIPYDALIWVTHAAPAPWLAESGLATDERGFVRVNAFLQSVSHPFVFAAGDCATMEDEDRPKSGVFAVRQGPYLAKNLRHAATGEAMEPFRPQRQFLGLVGTGDKSAVASRGRFAAEGAWVWRWKDRIDRTFMERYRVEGTSPGQAATPPMDREGAHHCGGCGAKAGPDLIRSVLAELGVDGALPFEDAAPLPHGGGALLQSVDLFRALVDDPYLLGRIATVHGLNDAYARGATPVSALAIAVLPFADEAAQSTLLRAMLAGVLDELNGSGGRLAGGHTAEGHEVMLGLAVTGECAHPPWAKTGARPGDVLLLTKAIGTGTIFAADMAGMVEGPTLDAAFRHMTHSNRGAAEVLRRFDVHACTDVSGFGLAGHAIEITEGEGAPIRMTIRTAHVPLLPQALECLSKGFVSSLHGRNRRFAEGHGLAEPSGDARVEALADPQTAGGLLAAVPQADAVACLDALRDAGYGDAAIVGMVDARESGAAALETL